MCRKNLISKIIIPAAGILTMLAAMTNCGSKTAGSNDLSNGGGKSANSSLVNTTPIESDGKTEIAPTDLSKIPTATYCELVRNAGAYNRKIVRLRAIYFTAFEKTYLYDSRCEKNTAPEAPENVPAEMWAEWDKTLITEGDSDEAKMNRRLKGFGRKDVTVVGRFYSTNEENNADAPNLFGHLNCCRFQFRIMRVENVINLDSKTVENVNGYGERVKFALYKKLEFADFTLEYVGDFQALLAAPHAPRELQPKHSFQISRAGKTIFVWVNEAKKNTPLEFEFGGANYQLESGISDTSGKLAADELIVRKTN